MLGTKAGRGRVLSFIPQSTRREPLVVLRPHLFEDRGERFQGRVRLPNLPPRIEKHGVRLRGEGGSWRREVHERNTWAKRISHEGEDKFLSGAVRGRVSHTPSPRDTNIRRGAARGRARGARPWRRRTSCARILPARSGFQELPERERDGALRAKSAGGTRSARSKPPRREVATAVRPSGVAQPKLPVSSK